MIPCSMFTIIKKVALKYFCEAIYLDLVDLNINDDDLVPLKTLHFVVYFLNIHDFSMSPLIVSI